MPTVFDPAIRLLVQIGLVDVILPFVLAFVVLFGVLEQTKPFGQGKKNVHAVLSLVAGLLVVASVDLLGAINRMSAFLSVILVTGLMVMMLFGMMGVQNVQKSKPLTYVVLALFFFGALYILGAFDFVSKRSLLNYFLPAVLLFALFVVLVWGVLKALPEKNKEETEQTKKSPEKKQKTPVSQGKEGEDLSQDDVNQLMQEAKDIENKLQQGKPITKDERLKLLTARGIITEIQEAQRRAQEQQAQAPRPGRR